MNMKLVARAVLPLVASCLLLTGCSPAPPPPLVPRDVAPLAIVDPAKPCSRLGTAPGTAPAPAAATGVKAAFDRPTNPLPLRAGDRVTSPRGKALATPRAAEVNPGGGCSEPTNVGTATLALPRPRPVLNERGPRATWPSDPGGIHRQRHLILMGRHQNQSNASRTSGLPARPRRRPDGHRPLRTALPRAQRDRVLRAVLAAGGQRRQHQEQHHLPPLLRALQLRGGRPRGHRQRGLLERGLRHRPAHRITRHEDPAQRGARQRQARDHPGRGLHRH